MDAGTASYNFASRNGGPGFFLRRVNYFGNSAIENGLVPFSGA